MLGSTSPMHRLLTPCVVGCTVFLGFTLFTAEAATEVVPATFPLTLASPAASLASSAVTLQAYQSINAWFSDYAHSRVTELSFPDRTLATFGPWSAWSDHGARDAAADGSLTEWAERYYITHDWSSYGQQILTMIPGDVVTVNGNTFVVDGCFEYPKSSFLNEVRAICGQDTYVLQTCVPAADRNRIVFGHAI